MRILQRDPVLVYDKWMVMRFIEKIVVHSDYMEIVFKAGPRINVENFGQML